MDKHWKWQTVWISWLALGCIAISVVLTIVASLLTNDANMVASTISDVAAGPYDWVQDLGLYILSVGLCGLAYSMLHLPACQWHWRAAVTTLPIMALSVTVMGFYQEYGDGDNESGVIHVYFVYMFGASFLALLLLSIPSLMRHNSWWRPLNLTWFCVWLAVAIYYFKMGTGWDGLVERGLGLAYLAWMFLLAWRLPTIEERST